MFKPRTRCLLLTLVLASAGSVAAEEPAVADPTRPYQVIETSEAPGVQSRGLELTAVLVSASRRVAIINGEIYREGERVNGELISRIESGAIRIRRGNDEVLIRIRPARVTENDGEQSR